jgi:hypothetical protein
MRLMLGIAHEELLQLLLTSEACDVGGKLGRICPCGKGKHG